MQSSQEPAAARFAPLNLSRNLRPVRPQGVGPGRKPGPCDFGGRASHGSPGDLQGFDSEGRMFSVKLAIFQ